MIKYEIERNPEIITESASLALISIPFILFLISILDREFKKSQLLRDINSNFDNEYLVMELEGSDIKQPDLLGKLFLIRKKEIGRILKNKSIVLVFNKDAYRILKSSFQTIEFFRILGTGESIEYSIDEFIQKYKKQFKILGEYRRNTNAEKFLYPFKSIDFSSLSEGAKLNLWWIGMVLRQLIKYGKDYGVEKVRFKSKKISSVEIIGQ